MESKQMKNSPELGKNKMGIMPVGKLLVTMSVPLIISMLVQALYNVVDSYFVAKLSNAALNAVSLAFPIQTLMIAFSVGTGVGMNSYIARCLGMGDRERANKGAANGMFLLFVTSLVFTVFGFVIEPFFKLFTDDPELIGLGVQYLRICMIFCMGVFLQIGCERILQSMGKNGASMLTQLIGAIVNIILDPMLIFGIGPFPELGIQGAAYATVIGQWVGMIIALLLVFVGKHEVEVSFKGFRPDEEAIGEIYRVGAPSIIMQSITSVMTIGLNAIFSRILLSEIGVSITGIYFKIQSIIFMPVFGLTNASMSIMAYNFGARNRLRFTAAFKRTLITALVIMLIGLAVFQIIPGQIVSMFDKDGTLTRSGAIAFRIISLSFPIAAVGIAISTLFQAIGRGFNSMIMSVLRQLGALLPIALVLALVFRSIDSVWWAFFLAEFVSFIYGIFMLKRTWRSEIESLPDGDAV